MINIYILNLIEEQNMKAIIFAAIVVGLLALSACSTKEVVEEIPAPEPVMVERG